MFSLLIKQTLTFAFCRTYTVYTNKNWNSGMSSCSGHGGYAVFDQEFQWYDLIYIASKYTTYTRAVQSKPGLPL